MKTILNAFRMALLACTIWLPGIAATAQTASNADTDALLQKQVHLRLGEVTALKAAQSISDQTGIVVKLDDSLVEHRLTLSLDDLSARAALDALADLNDWVWIKTSPGNLLIKQRSLNLPVQAASIPRKIQAAIPEHLRNYMAMTRPFDDIERYVNPFANQAYQMSGQPITDRLARATAYDTKYFITSLPPEIRREQKLPYAKLTAEQRHWLLDMIVFPLLRQTPFELLHGDLLPHVADAANAVISIENGSVLVGSRVSDGKGQIGIGFGASVK